MKNENLINILIYVLAITLIWTVAYPMYNGGGTNLLGKTNSILSEMAKKKELDNLSMIAVQLRTDGVNQGEAFRNIEADKIDRVDKAIAKKIDISRVINDFDKMSQASKLKMASISFAKNSGNKKYSNLNVYDINLSLEGDYLNFRQFISTVENSLELYNVKAVNFSGDEDGSGSYKINVILEAFELK